MIELSDFILFCQTKLGFDTSSIKLCRIRVNIFEGWVGGREITPHLTEEFLFSLKEQGLKNNSINSYVFSLRQLDKYAFDRKLPFAGFTEGLKTLPKTTTLIQILEIEEINKLLDTHIVYRPFHYQDASRLDGLYKTIIRFLSTTGCRLDECLSLKTTDISLSGDRGTAMFRDTKTNSPRMAFLTDPLVAELRELTRDRSGYVFTSMTGSKVLPQSFLEDLHQRAKLAGITKRVHPHLFRYSFVSRLCSQAKVPIEAVASLVGHKDIQTTFGVYYRSGSEYLKSQVYRDPLIRGYIPCREAIELCLNNVKTEAVFMDNRFEKQITDNGDEILIRVKIKK